MNNKTLTNQVGFIFGTVLLAVLTGCTTYVERPREVYAPPPPVVYVPPPPVYVPTPPIYVPPPAVQVEVSPGFVGVEIRSENDFYQPLSTYGRWEVVGSYGRCWIPGRVEADWR